MEITDSRTWLRICLNGETHVELEERWREKKRKETSACLGVVLKDKKFEAPYTKQMNELKKTL